MRTLCNGDHLQTVGSATRTLYIMVITCGQLVQLSGLGVCNDSHLQAIG